MLRLAGKQVNAEASLVMKREQENPFGIVRIFARHSGYASHLGAKPLGAFVTPVPLSSWIQSMVRLSIR